MNHYIRDSLIILIYSCILVIQLSFSSFMINKSSDINNILQNYQNISDCKNDAIYRLKDGSLIEIALAIIISSSLIITSFLLIVFSKYKKQNNNYEILDNYNTGIINSYIINRDLFDMTINIIFIMAVLCFIISNGIQFILQLNNISNACLTYIDKYIDNFYVIYKIQTCTSFFASFALFFILPCFI